MKLVYADYGAYRLIDNTSWRKHNQNEARLELEFEMRLNVASTTTTMSALHVACGSSWPYTNFVPAVRID